ncbi:hypothetical protein THICB3560305 [Thiomonas sp. CB3]|nr:hypothetical protein THICB3560305 [Thiomonas sp. CB3]
MMRCIAPGLGAASATQTASHRKKRDALFDTPCQRLLFKLCQRFLLENARPALDCRRFDWNTIAAEHRGSGR